MCLILLAHHQHPDYPLIVAANRDEFYDRPTAPADLWPDAPEVLAGRDLQAGGSWLGVTRSGRFAAVTNFRDGADRGSYPRSRGELVAGFLQGSMQPDAYLRALRRRERDYGGFNLLLGAGDHLYYHSNRGGESGALAPGVYGLSNHLLNTPWPKVAQGRSEFLDALLEHPEPQKLLSLLRDNRPAADDELPDTGVSLDLERLLSSRFIHSEHYGTRASTVMLRHRSGETELWEQNFDAQGPAGALRHFILPPAA